MKYIRTKENKIYLLHEDLFTSGVWWFETKEEVLQISCVPSDLGKIADTIEELCDEFVVKIKTGYLITYYDKKLLTQDAIKNGADVYGAIWTDKGLIYVAKMNDKGEIELL